MPTVVLGLLPVTLPGPMPPPYLPDPKDNHQHFLPDTLVPPGVKSLQPFLNFWTSSVPRMHVQISLLMVCPPGGR